MHRLWWVAVVVGVVLLALPHNLGYLFLVLGVAGLATEFVHRAFIPVLVGLGSLALAALFLEDPAASNGTALHIVLAIVALKLAVLMALVARAAVRAKLQPPLTGVDNLMGEDAVALTALTPDGTVRIHGQVWQARAMAPVPAGATVLVVGREGLVLEVSPSVETEVR